MNPTFVTLLALCILSGCAQKEIGVMNFPEGAVQHSVRADAVDWKPCPATLPSGCLVSVLEGDPKKPDLFTVRFKVDETFYMPPHTHAKEERVTILSGKVSVAFGSNGKHDDAITFGPGDYYVNARDTVHSVLAESPSVVQITGIGPWEAHFIK